MFKAKERAIDWSNQELPPDIVLSGKSIEEQVRRLQELTPQELQEFVFLAADRMIYGPKSQNDSYLRFAIFHHDIFTRLPDTDQKRLLRLFLLNFFSDEAISDTLSQSEALSTNLEISEFSQINERIVAMSPLSINPYTYLLTQHIYSDLERYAIIFSGSELQTIIRLGIVYGFFKGRHAHTYRRVLGRYIRDYFPAYALELRPPVEEWTDSKTVRDTKSMLIKTRAAFSTHYLNWAREDRRITAKQASVLDLKYTPSTVARNRRLQSKILVPEKNETDAAKQLAEITPIKVNSDRPYETTDTSGFIGQSGAYERAQAEVILRDAQFRKKRNNYIKDIAATFLPEKYTRDKTPTEQLFNTLRTEVPSKELQEFLALLPRIAADFSSESMNNPLLVTKKLSEIERRIWELSFKYHRKSDSLLWTNENSHEHPAVRLSRLFFILEARTLQEYPDDIQADIPEAFQLIFLQLTRLLKNYHDVPPSTPVTPSLPGKDPDNFDPDVFERIRKQALARLAAQKPKSGFMSTTHPLFTGLVSLREHNVKEIEKIARLQNISFREAYRSDKIKWSIHTSMVKLYGIAIFPAIFLANAHVLFTENRGTSSELLTRYLSLFVPAALGYLSLVYAEATKQDRIRPTRFAFDLKNSLKSNVESLISQREQRIRREMKNQLFWVLFWGALSLLPTAGTAIRESGGEVTKWLDERGKDIARVIDEILPDQPQENTIILAPPPTSVSSSVEGISEIERFSGFGITGEGVPIPEELRKTDVLPRNTPELPRNDNPLFEIESRSEFASFFLQQACELTSDDLRQNGCLIPTDERLTFEEVPAIIHVQTDIEFAAQKEQYLEQGALVVTNKTQREFMEVPVGFELRGLLVLGPDEQTQAVWSPLGGVLFRASNHQKIAGVFERVTDNATVASSDSDTTLSFLTFDALPDLQLQNDFAGKEKLLSYIETTRNDYQAGVPVNEAIRHIVDRLYADGREYGFAQFDPGAYADNASIAGAVITQDNTICNMSSWLAVAVAREAGYTNVGLARGFVSSFRSNPNGGTSRDYHQLALYASDENGKAVWRIVDATLPGTGLLNQLGLFTREEAETLGFSQNLPEEQVENLRLTYVPQGTPIPRMTATQQAPETLPNLEIARQFFITKKDTNIRNRAGTDSTQVIGSVPIGTRLEILGEKQVGTEFWYMVHSEEKNLTGWVRSDLGSVETETIPLPTAIPSETPTPTPTLTSTPSPSPTSTEQMEPTATYTPSSVPTETITLSPSPTPEQSSTEQPSAEQSEQIDPAPVVAGLGVLAGIGYAIRRRLRWNTMKREAQEVIDRRAAQEKAAKEKAAKEQLIRQRTPIGAIAVKYFLFVHEFYKKQGQSLFTPEQMIQGIARDIHQDLLEPDKRDPSWKYFFVEDVSAIPNIQLLQSKMAQEQRLTRDEVLAAYPKQDRISQLGNVVEILTKHPTLTQVELSAFQSQAYKDSVVKKLDWEKLISTYVPDHDRQAKIIAELSSIQAPGSLRSEESLEKTREGLTQLIQELSKTQTQEEKILRSMLLSLRRAIE